MPVAVALVLGLVLAVVVAVATDMIRKMGYMANYVRFYFMRSF